MSLNYGRLISFCLSVKLPCCSECSLGTTRVLTHIDLTTALLSRHDPSSCKGQLCGAHIAGLVSFRYIRFTVCIIFQCVFPFANFQSKVKLPESRPLFIYLFAFLPIYLFLYMPMQNLSDCASDFIDMIQEILVIRQNHYLY